MNGNLRFSANEATGWVLAQHPQAQSHLRGRRACSVSLFLTTDRNAALIVLRLVQHYDGEVLAYKLGDEIELDSLG